MALKLRQYTLDGNNGITTFGYIDVPPGTVTSVAALTLGTTGTDLSSTVANGSTTAVITLQVPTASAANRGALSAADWSTFNAKQAAITFGTGVQTALGVNVGSAGAVVTFNGAGGTPSSIVLTNATGTASGLTAGTASAVAVGGITGLGTGVATALAINLESTGAPMLFNGTGGTPSSMTGTNITGTAAGLTAGVASAVAVGGITGLGTGVATALAVNVGSAGAFVTFNGALGTPSSGTLTNATGLPAAGVTGTALVSAAIGTTVQAYDADLTTWAGITPGANVGTFLATPSSANLAAAVTDETGSGKLVFDNAPSFTTGIGIGAAAAGAGGVAFPATAVAVSDVNTLDDYDEYVSASTACSGALTDAVVWTIIKIGKHVTLRLPAVYNTASGSVANITYGLTIPTKYRPPATVVNWFSKVIAGSLVATPGMVHVSSAGVITLYSDGTLATSWGTAANTGMYLDAFVCWIIA